jgi:hypothetical protein
MPRGPKGEKRPADVIGNAVHVMRIATGEIEEKFPPPSPTRAEHARRAGMKGGEIRAKKLSPKQRKEIASKAANKRWKKESEGIT